MGIAGAVRALSPAFRTRVVGRRAQVGPLQRPSLIFVTRPQADFRTSTGSIRARARRQVLSGADFLEMPEDA